jgi:DNA polymerase III subunit alpha
MGVVFFPRVFEEASGLVHPDSVVAVRGRLDLRGREPQIVASRVESMGVETATTAVGGDKSRLVSLNLDLKSCTPALIKRLQALLKAYPGDCPVELNVRGSGGERRLQLPPELLVEPSVALLSELRYLLGPHVVPLGTSLPSSRQLI